MASSKDFLKVIGCGFGRTGTMSLMVALNQLGYRCHHMKEILMDKNPLDNWEKLALQQARGEDTLETLQAAYKEYDATVDFPGASFFEDLMRANPNAKVILSLHPRGAEGWYESLTETIASFENRFENYILKTHLVSTKTNRLWRWISFLVWQGTLNGEIFSDKQATINEYHKRIELAKRIVPANQLLVFMPTDGWEPLCRFLEKPIPLKEYPNINDRKEILLMFNAMKKLAMMTAVFYVAIILGVGYGVNKATELGPVMSGLVGILFFAILMKLRNPGPIPIHRKKMDKKKEQ